MQQFWLKFKYVLPVLFEFQMSTVYNGLKTKNFVKVTKVKNKKTLFILCHNFIIKTQFVYNIHTDEMDPAYSKNVVDYRSLGNMPGYEWKLLRVCHVAEIAFQVSKYHSIAVQVPRVASGRRLPSALSPGFGGPCDPTYYSHRNFDAHPCDSAVQRG